MKTSLVALLLVLANLASAQTAAAAATAGVSTAGIPSTAANPEEGNQGSRRIQRLCRRSAADGPCRQDQRTGSLPHSVSQQRDERGCAGIADGHLPAGQQPGQSHRHGEPPSGGEPGQRSRPGAAGLQRARRPEVARRQTTCRARIAGGREDAQSGRRF